MILHNRSHYLAPFNSFFSQTTLDCFHYLELFATTKQIYIPTKVAGTVPLISNYILVLLCVISLNYILHVTITLEPSTLELFLVVKDGTELGLDSIRIFNHKYIEGKCTWLSRACVRNLDLRPAGAVCSIEGSSWRQNPRVSIVLNLKICGFVHPCY